MNNPPDLINVALETLVSQSLELPGFTTLDEMAAAIRAEVNREIMFGINDRITAMERAALLATLHVWELDNESMFTRMKKPAKRPTWSRFKDHSQYLKEIDALGETGKWVEGVAESKIADFAAEAAAQDAGTLRDYDPVKQVELVACLVHTARARARDDLADMLCKRVSVIVKKAKAELDDIRTRQRTVTEKLIAGYKSVLEQLGPDGATTATDYAAAEMAHQALRTVAGGAAGASVHGDGEPVDETGWPMLRLAGLQGEALVSVVRAWEIQAEGLGAIRTQVAAAGGFAAQLRDIEEVSAYHGDNHEMLMQRFFRKDRAVMFELAGRLKFEATSTDRSVLDALDWALQHWTLTRDHIPDHYVTRDDKGDEVRVEVDTSFASGNWQKVIRQLVAEGWQVTAEDLAQLSPYLTSHILRFGAYATDELHIPPDVFAPALDEVDFGGEQPARRT